MTLSPRAYWKLGLAASWEELWDASQYFDRVGELLEDAQSSVLIVGWQLDSRLLLLKPARPGSSETPALETLRDKVLRLCQDRPKLRFYLLLWGHPTLYIPQREWLQTRVWEELHPHVHLVFDNRHPFGASHHEKLVQIDGRVTLLGGIDLCADRWDSTAHFRKDPRRSLSRSLESYGPYHELGVQVTGPICQLLHQHIRRRWRRLSTVPLPDPPEPPFHVQEQAYHHVWVSRTRSTVDAGEERRPITREIEFLFTQLIREAKSDLWLEGQYFWSRKVQETLIERIQSEKIYLKITIILADLSHLKFLPAKMAWYQAKLLSDLQRAAEKNPQVSLRVLRPSSHERPIYVHSKMMLVDDRYLSIGSANFSARALRMDSEIMLTFEAINSYELSKLRRFRKELENHWKPTSLYSVDSIAEEKLIRKKAPFLSQIQWQKGLDPEIPFFHHLKRRFFTRIERRTACITTGALALSFYWILGSLPLAFFLLQNRSEISIMDGILCALLYSVWILPIPFLALLILITLNIPEDISRKFIIFSWWLSSVISFSWGRSFPSTLRRWTDQHSPRPITSFGKRRFASILRAGLDPRSTTHDKVLWQNRYWIPFPWFILIHGLLMTLGLLAIHYLIHQVIRS